jgi:hypothetical protein
MTPRVDWAALPPTLQAGIERELGGSVVDAVNVSGGFSPGFVARLATADGSRVFVKAMANPGWRFLYDREARLAPSLPRGAPFPRWRFTIDDGDWIALGFDVIDGREPTIPWTPADLDRVLAAHLTMTDRLGPSPTSGALAAVEAAGDVWGDAFRRWRDLDHATVRDRLSPAWARHVDDLRALEATWPTQTRGDHIIHLDLRADNVVVTDHEVYVVDWAFAARGQPWMDLVCLLPNVALRDGPDPETVWRAHPWHEQTDSDAFDAFLTGWAGMLTHFALTTESPLLGPLRRLHAEQAAAARTWLARRRGWDDCEP